MLYFFGNFKPFEISHDCITFGSLCPKSLYKWPQTSECMVHSYKDGKLCWFFIRFLPQLQLTITQLFSITKYCPRDSQGFQFFRYIKLKAWGEARRPKGFSRGLKLIPKGFQFFFYISPIIPYYWKPEVSGNVLRSVKRMAMPFHFPPWGAFYDDT